MRGAELSRVVDVEARRPGVIREIEQEGHKIQVHVVRESGRRALHGLAPEQIIEVGDSFKIRYGEVNVLVLIDSDFHAAGDDVLLRECRAALRDESRRTLHPNPEPVLIRDEPLVRT
jgi:hypothetical protein